MKKKPQPYIFLILLGFLIQCTMPASDSIFYYTDQNNNRYTISPDTLSYLPIKKENSSSGEYDGGESATVALSKKEYKTISEKALELLADTSKHTNKRMMMTSIIALKEPSERATLVKSKKRTDFENLLNELLKTD